MDFYIIGVEVSHVHANWQRDRAWGVSLSLNNTRYCLSETSLQEIKCVEDSSSTLGLAAGTKEPEYSQPTVTFA